MPTTLNLLTAKILHDRLATVAIFQLFLVGLVNLLLNGSSDNVFWTGDK